MVAEKFYRLYSKELPDKERLFRLVDQYFANIHPLRCFGFIHKPSFMQRLDEQRTDDSLSLRIEPFNVSVQHPRADESQKKGQRRAETPARLVSTKGRRRITWRSLALCASLLDVLALPTRSYSLVSQRLSALELNAIRPI